jgi:hypothetical protein
MSRTRFLLRNSPVPANPPGSLKDTITVSSTEPTLLDDTQFHKWSGASFALGFKNFGLFMTQTTRTAMVHATPNPDKQPSKVARKYSCPESL